MAAKPLHTVPALIAGLLVVTACSTPTETVKFKSEAERQCYAEASAALPNSNTSLARKGDTFIEVITVDGFVRSTRPSPSFEACMLRVQGANAPNRLSAEGGLKFTGEEQVIWNRMTDAEKQDAYRFMRNGGSLSEWAAGRDI
jgi:hypothetical protein